MKKRYVSLDVLRGLTVALMIIVNNPGSWSCIFPPLRHAAWDGCTPTDLVFPSGSVISWMDQPGMLFLEKGIMPISFIA